MKHPWDLGCPLGAGPENGKGGWGVEYRGGGGPKLWDPRQEKGWVLSKLHRKIHFLEYPGIPGNSPGIPPRIPPKIPPELSGNSPK